MPFIQTLSGKHINYTDIQHDDIVIEDIATSLSHICRFAGHLPEFYSVAQHSVLVSQLVPAEFALEALAAENAALKSAFDKPQAYLSWHAIPPTWDEPLPCGEYLDVHDTDGHKNSDGTDCWPVFAKPEIETPATDAWVNEQRARAFDSLAGVAETMLIKFSNALCSSDMHEVVGWKKVHEQATRAAAQLRGSHV
ncbi:hypothetical protein [Atlantibacter sp.]|uniref:hypothetical protein n=1 Tax=Atlantibacter sp. TaxID=1903473 RepID=UPI0028ABBBA5|nr:hypothetical protein [Atlantibacter sp.]